MISFSYFLTSSSIKSVIFSPFILYVCRQQGIYQYHYAKKYFSLPTVLRYYWYGSTGILTIVFIRLPFTYVRTYILCYVSFYLFKLTKFNIRLNVWITI